MCSYSELGQLVDLSVNLFFTSLKQILLLSPQGNAVGESYVKSILYFQEGKCASASDSVKTEDCSASN